MSQQLPEKYQERAASRRRGAGGHQAEFRGFTIQAPPKKILSDPLANKDSTNNGQQQQENQTTLTTTARPVLPPSTPPGILQNRYGSPSVVVYRKDTNVATPAIVASGGGTPRTRLASRESGVSPTYQILWGRETTVVMTQRPSPVSSSSQSVLSLSQTTTPQSASTKDHVQKRAAVYNDDDDDDDDDDGDGDGDGDDDGNDDIWFLRKGKQIESTEQKMMRSEDQRTPKKRRMIIEEDSDAEEQEMPVARVTSKTTSVKTLRGLGSRDSLGSANESEQENHDEAEWQEISDEEQELLKITRPKQQTKTRTKPGVSRPRKERGETVRIRVHKIKRAGLASGRSAKDKSKATEANNDQDDGSTKKKTVRAAPVRINEADVVGSVIAEVIEDFAKTIDDVSVREAIELFASEMDARMIEQTDLYDEHVLLQDSLRKARAHKRHLRQRLLVAQWRRQEVRAELAAAREGFKTAEEERKKLEQLHGFLTDIEVLRDAIWDNRGVNDGKVAERQDVSGSKDGIEGLVTTLVARSGTPSASVSTGKSGTAAPGGVLDALRRFNDLLEACDVAVRKGLEKG